jgi:ankyrin repeat protein
MRIEVIAAQWRTRVCRLTGVALLALCCAGAGAPGDALYDRFIQSVAIDRSDDVAAILARGMDPNTVDPNGEPVLVVAARAGWIPTTDLLLKAGAKVDAKNSFGDTAIMVAALNGHIELVKKLQARGADINPRGWTPLAYAASNGKTDVVQYLLGVGADINARSPNGTTPLMMAVRGGHEATVDLLLAKGADPNLRNQNDASALAWATRGGFFAIEQSLRKQGAKP